MEQNPFQETEDRSIAQQRPRLWNLKRHYRYKSRLLDPILSQLNPIHNLTLHCFKIHFIFLSYLFQSLTSRLFLSAFTSKVLYEFLCNPTACDMLCPFHPNNKHIVMSSNYVAYPYNTFSTILFLLYLRTNILVSPSFWNTFNLCSSRSSKFHTHKPVGLNKTEPQYPFKCFRKVVYSWTN